MTKDIFDIVAEEPDIFDRLDSDIFDRLGGDEQDVRTIVKKELSRMRPLERIIERPIIQQMPGQKVKEIVKEVRIETPKDTKKYAEEKNVSALKTELADLKDQLERMREVLPLLTNHGGSGVVGVPNPQGQSGKFLTTDGNKITWASTDPNSNKEVVLDYNGTSYPVYIGWADPGSSQTTGVWKIEKLTYDANFNVTAAQFANGSSAYAYKWSDRATYTYS